MEERIKKVLSEVLKIKISKINAKSSPDNIESWDSLKHVYLVVALEEEFKVSFSSDDIIKMLNFKLIKLIIKEKLSKK